MQSMRLSTLQKTAANGVIDRVFAKLQEKQTVRIKIEVLSMDSTGVKIYPDAAGARKKKRASVCRSLSRGQKHQNSYGSANDRIAIAFHLSTGQCHYSPQGRLFPEDLRLDKLAEYMPMDRGYEDDLTRKDVKHRGFKPVVPPKSNLNLALIYGEFKLCKHEVIGKGIDN
jgi:hypothetical protein